MGHVGSNCRSSKIFAYRPEPAILRCRPIQPNGRVTEKVYTYLQFVSRVTRVPIYIITIFYTIGRMYI